jgi:hypothetical protein
MTKQEKNAYNKVYKYYRYKMGMPCFKLFKRVKPIKAYGFWVDSFGSEDKVFVPQQIPFDYVIDIFCELIAMSKVYYTNSWLTQSSQTYYTTHFKEKLPLHDRSHLLLKTLLRILAESNSEKGFFKWYREMESLIKAIY